MIYFALPQALRKAFLFPANARQSVTPPVLVVKNWKLTGWRAFAFEAKMEACICPICGVKHNNKNNNKLRPFCSYECADIDVQKGGKWIKEFISIHRFYSGRSKCFVCGKIIFERKYCSPDCKRVAIQAVDKRRREPIPERYKKSIYSKNDYMCFYCGSNANCIDHIYPVSRGGRTVEDNLVAACSTCNSIAGAKTFSSLEEKKKYILSKREIEVQQHGVNQEFIRPAWHAFVYSGKKRK